MVKDSGTPDSSLFSQPVTLGVFADFEGKDHLKGGGGVTVRPVRIPEPDSSVGNAPN